MNYENMTIDYVKEYLHIDFTEDDNILLMLMESAKSHIREITKIKIEEFEEYPKALNQVFLYLVSLWYEQRLPIGSTNKEIDFTISMLMNPYICGGIR